MDHKINQDTYYIYLDQSMWVVGTFKIKYDPLVLKKGLKGFETFEWREQASKECAKRNFDIAVAEGWVDNQVSWVKSFPYSYRDYYEKEINR